MLSSSHLPLSPSPLFLIFPSCFYSISPFPPPLSALHAFALLRHTHSYIPTPAVPPHLFSPSTPTRMVIKAKGNSLDLKISMSLSLCSCRVASPKAAPRYGWALSVRLVWGLYIHTCTPENAHTLFPKDIQKQLALLFSSFVTAIICPPASLAIVRSCGFTAVRMGLRTQQQ